MVMNVNFDINAWTVAQFMMTFGLALFVAMSTRKKAETDALKKMEKDLQASIKDSKDTLAKRLEQHSGRLSRIESDIENSIGVEDMKAVHRRVDEILANSKNMEGQLMMLISNVKEIHSIMLSRGNHER
jgi:hypothetical protein